MIAGSGGLLATSRPLSAPMIPWPLMPLPTLRCHAARAGQHMDMPWLGVHRRRRAFGGFKGLLDHRTRDGFFLDPAHALAGLDQRLDFHCFLSFLVRLVAS